MSTLEHEPDGETPDESAETEQVQLSEIGIDELRAIVDFADDEESEYARTFFGLDQSRSELIDLVSLAFAELDINYTTDISNAGTALIYKFKSALQLIDRDNDNIEQKARIIAELHKYDDKVLYDAFRVLAPSEFYDNVTFAEEFEESIQTLFEENGSEGAIDYLLTEYTNALGILITHVLSHVPPPPESTEFTSFTYELPRKTRILRAIGSHSLDVGKLIVGIAGGLVVANLITKKR